MLLDSSLVHQRSHYGPAEELRAKPAWLWQFTAFTPISSLLPGSLCGKGAGLRKQDGLGEETRSDMRIARFNCRPSHFSAASQKAWRSLNGLGWVAGERAHPGCAANVQRAAAGIWCEHSHSHVRQMPSEQQHGTGRLLARLAAPHCVPSHKGSAKYRHAFNLDFLSSPSGEL